MQGGPRQGGLGGGAPLAARAVGAPIGAVGGHLAGQQQQQQQFLQQQQQFAAQFGGGNQFFQQQPGAGGAPGGAFQAAPGVPGAFPLASAAAVPAAEPVDLVQAQRSIVNESFMTAERFDNQTQVCAESRRALKEVMKLEWLTEVQAGTLQPALQGLDILGRARTGTGKTLAFLLPAVENLRKANAGRTTRTIPVLVISPTRELATQITNQAKALTTFQTDTISVQVVMGGTNMSSEAKRIMARTPGILVGTPGRLLDHLKNTTNLTQMINNLSVLVLDEADQLLEMGFRPDIERILAFLPKRRQTLLFSATMPTGLREVVGLALQKSHVVIDCINDHDPNSHTNAQVEQEYVVLEDFQRLVTSTVEVVLAARASDPNHKIIGFFPTARLTGFFATFFNRALNVPVLEIHSRKSQTQRNKTSDIFRQGHGLILFSSDVSARGVDYPDVTHVLQFGLPESREQYVHRLGRTARAGRAGRGLLVLAPFEEPFLRELGTMPITKSADWSARLNAPQLHPQLEQTVQEALMRVGQDGDLHRTAEQAYQAWLGFYNSNMRRMKGRWDKPQLVRVANVFATLIGLEQPPALLKRTVGKMGLKGVPGLRIE